MFTAFTFSSICATFDVPGISSILALWWYSQLRATCCMVALWRAAISFSFSTYSMLPAFMGFQGMKAIPSCSQYFSSGSQLRYTMLYLFCSDTISTYSLAFFISAMLTSDKPMCFMRPCLCASFRNSSVFSNGTLGSIRCSWYRSIWSTFRRLRLPSRAFFK